MNNLKSIRKLLGVTQQVMADGIGCSQGNVGHYERGQTLPPDMAKRVIDFAACKGLALTMGQLYGMEPLAGETHRTLTPELPQPSTSTVERA